MSIFRYIRRNIETVDQLDRPMFHFPDGTPYYPRDLLRHIAVFGQTGSGKSSGSGLHFARAILRLPNSGGLILSSKPEDKQFWQRLFAAVGRQDDLVLFSRREDKRFNVLNSVGGDSHDATRFILTVAESLGQEQQKSGEKFWENEKKRAVYNIVEMLRQGQGFIDAPGMMNFITGAAIHPDQIADPKWRAGFHHQIIEKASTRFKTPIDLFDYQLCTNYWLREWPVMDSKQRSGVLAEVMSVLHPFNTGIVRELISTSTSASPEDMTKGKFILVDEDPETAAGKFVLVAWKFCTQQYLLKRKAEPGDGICVIWSDEFQGVMNSADAEFLAKARSHLAAQVMLTQSQHSYFSSMSGERGKHYVEALLTNSYLKIFHQLGDAKSAEYASSLLGKRRERFISLSPGKEVSNYELLAGESTYKPNVSEQYQPVLQPSIFMDGLRTGGPQNSFLVDGIVVSSDRFKSGERYLKVAFPQR